MMSNLDNLRTQRHLGTEKQWIDPVMHLLENTVGAWRHWFLHICFSLSAVVGLAH